MKLFLDCEFTQLNQDTKLISLALVSEARDEFYVELTDTYKIEDCSDFVIQHVLPQLDQLRYGRSLVDAQAALRVFLGGLDGQLEVCSDAPEWGLGVFLPACVCGSQVAESFGEQPYQSHPLVQAF
ncbi:MAG: hypothetical protein WC749_01795 [Dehalococcoidia bacterium]|uniref:hypothetical protein n=1 Tax=Pseudomonas TaxID=286 RepID=UPI0028526B99|nr:hypothetical protein [Pseudomonas atacamensis]